MGSFRATIRVEDDAFREQVKTAVDAIWDPALDGVLEVVGPEGPADPDALWIAVVTDSAQALDAMRRGAADALFTTDLHRLPIAVEHARRALRTRALDRLFELSPDSLEITDANMRYVEVNPAFERLFGIRGEDTVGRTPGALLRGGTHGAAFYEAIEQRLLAGRPWTGSMVARRGSGLTMQEVVAGPVRVGGVIARIVGIRRDGSSGWIEPIPDEPAPARIRHHLESAATRPWVLHDAEGTVADANAGAGRVFGCDRSALLGTAVGSISIDDPPVLTPAFWRRVLDDEGGSVDILARDRALEVRSVPIQLGDARFLLTVFEDITDRKQHQDALIASTRELENARDEAVRSSQAKSTFLANMSHELRTPLNAILGYTELLLEDLESPQAPSDLDRVRRAGLHLLGLVDDILDLSRIESRRIELSPEAVQVADVVREVVDAMRPAARAGGNDLVVRPFPDVVLFTDRRRFAQILLNLLGNACKFTQGGRVVLSVQPGPHTVEFVVADDGPGIPPALMPRLFDPFERGNAVRTHPGTGLGLAISRRLARALGGELWAESPRRGAEFVLVLPPDALRDRNA